MFADTQSLSRLGWEEVREREKIEGANLGERG